MPDREHLLEAFARGALVRPSPSQMGLVDVVRAVYSACGVDVPLSTHSQELLERIAGAEHYILLLADGMGIDFIDRMPRDSWLRRHTLRTVHGSFPSTTTSAVTTIATAEYPATHGVTGWWVRLDELGSAATVFAHDRAIDGRPLDRMGIGVDAIVNGPARFDSMRAATALVVPEGIVDSPYTRYVGGSAERIGYRTFDEAVTLIVERIRNATGPTFTYWYTPSPDAEAHDEGINGDRIFRTLDNLGRSAGRMADALWEIRKPWRLIGTADHGHQMLEPRLELEQTDPIMQHIESPPSGDMRLQFWHTRPSSASTFEAVFRQRFGPWFYLLGAENFESLGLIGPEPWSDATRRRTGTHVSISRGRAALRFAGYPGRGGYRRMRSGHSGLTAAEMIVPLILAGEEVQHHDYRG